MRLIATFPNRAECEKAVAWVTQASLPFTLLSPDPGYARVGVAGLVVDEDVRFRLASDPSARFCCSGWVEFQPAGRSVPASPPPEFAPDVLGQLAVMVLQPCMADTTKIRVIAHFAGPLGEVFPYLNAVMPDASYNTNGPILTFMEGYRMITLYPWRIAVAKADDLVDVWRVLERIRVRANTCWQNRATITPCFTLRQRPPALEIYYRLPRTNCDACGETTCLAFSFKLWRGLTTLFKCAPVFSGSAGHLEPALLEICAGLGVRREEP